MEKTLNKRQRRSVYLQLAKKLAKKIEKANTKSDFRLCIDIRREGINRYGAEWRVYWETPKYYPEYGLINPRCREHGNDNERIIALLFAYQMTF